MKTHLSSAGTLGLTSPTPTGTSSFWRAEGHAVCINLARCEGFDSWRVHLWGKLKFQSNKKIEKNQGGSFSGTGIFTFSNVPLAGLLGTACHPSSPPVCPPPPGAPERKYFINFIHLLVLLRENISINIVHPIMLQISSNIAQVRNIFSDSFPESSICQTKHILDGIW